MRYALVLALLLVSCGGPTDASDQTVTAAVRGRVVDANGIGVPDARVHIQAVREEPGGGGTTYDERVLTTAADGRFETLLAALLASPATAELRVAVVRAGTNHPLVLASGVVNFTHDAVPPDTTVILVQLPE